MNVALTKHKDIFSIRNIVHIHSHQGVNFSNEIIFLLRLLSTFLWVDLAFALCHNTLLPPPSPIPHSVKSDTHSCEVMFVLGPLVRDSG